MNWMSNNRYEMDRSKIGNFMYKITNNASKFLIKHKIVYYILSYTWGLATSIVGLLTTLVLLIMGEKREGWYRVWYFRRGKLWGGVSLGSMFVRDDTSSISINEHEYGHTFQNAIYGPFFIFLIAIPSCIRYRYRNYNVKRKYVNKPYDVIWFEASATEIGYNAVNSN